MSVTSRVAWWSHLAPRSAWACEHGELVIAWRPLGAGRTQRAPLKCRSRNHPGECQDAWRRRLFARLHGSELATLPLEELVFVTLTLPGSEHGEDHAELHAYIGACWNRLRTTMARRWGLKGYVWVRESHRSGVPHLHAVVASRWLAAEVQVAAAELAAMEAEGDAATIAPRALRDAAVAAGFGIRCDASLVRDRRSVQSYVSKVCGELSKASQLAIVPKGVRCYGASKGFLPPIRKPTGTGWLESAHERGAVVVRPTVAARSSYERDQDFERAWARAWKRAELRFQVGPRHDVPVVSPADDLAYFPTTDAAMEYVHGGVGGPSRHYVLRRDISYSPPPPPCSTT